MSIGLIIKRLRIERSMTQEELSEYLNISAQAISGWETGKSLPDITAVPLLARIFNVSSDVLLGIDNNQTEKSIDEFLLKYQEFNREAKIKEKYNLSCEMYRQYPNDFRVIDKYIYELFYDPNCVNEPFGCEVHKDELYKLCNLVIRDCADQKIRYNAINILGSLYCADGNIEKAIALCYEYPETYYDTQNEQLEQVFAWCDDEKYVNAMQKNILDVFVHLVNKIQNLGAHKACNNGEKIAICEKCITLIETIYDNNPDGIALYYMGHIYCLIGRMLICENDSDNAVKHIEKGLELLNRFDKLDKNTKVCHAAMLIKGTIEDLSEISFASDEGCVAFEIAEIEKNNCGKGVSTALEELLEKYKSTTTKR